MDEKHKCPVCGQFDFDEYASLEICEICGWQDDMYQVNNPDTTVGANWVSFNEAKRNYAKLGVSKPGFKWLDEDD